MMLHGFLRLAFVAAMAFGFVGVDVARALTIELNDVAADRIERQRAAAVGALPLPGTPNVAVLQERLRDKGVSLAEPILIRIFKAESELEIWKQKGDAYVLFATYPICHWSGTIGPKLRDGDRQAPEGFYTVTRSQTRHVGRWPKSLDIGYPEYPRSIAGKNRIEHIDPRRLLVHRLLRDDQPGFGRDPPDDRGGD